MFKKCNLEVRMIPFQQITKTIAELLYKHDCVIVPNFGGFVARNTSSKFNKGNDVLFPPSKQILFNKNLIHQDGLLSSAITDAYNISYTEVSKLLIDYVAYINSLLAVKKRFELDNIGLLYIDSENLLRFEAKTDVNFLIESFGFDPVVASEINLPVLVAERVNNQFTDRKITVAEQQKKQTKYAKIAALAVGVPIAFALLLWAVSSKPIQPVLQSSLNPFYNPEKLYTPNLNFSSKFIKISEAETVVPTKMDNGLTYFTVGDNNNVIIASNSDFSETKLTSKNDVKTSNNSVLNVEGKFQVVVGCFGVETNAKKLIKELKNSNITAGISGVNAKGLHVVSCGGFNTKEEANNLLSEIKSNYPSAWIMAQ